MPRSTTLPGRSAFKRLSWPSTSGQGARFDRVRVELLARCLAERIEPPTAGRIDRIVRSALHRGEELLVARVIARLPEVVQARLLALVAVAADDDNEHDDGDGPAVLSSIRSEPGNVSLNTMLTDQLVRDTVFPVASQAVLADLVAEFKSSGPTYQRTVKATLKGSYTNHYRTGLIKLLDVLEFRSNNTTHRPVLDALELITRHASAGNLHSSTTRRYASP